MNLKKQRSESKTDPWEKGDFGLEEEFIARADPNESVELDEALELKMISIRLQSELIEKLKFIAKFHGIGYQPLIRDLLYRFARSELRQIAHELSENSRAETLSTEDSPAAKYMDAAPEKKIA